MTDEELKPCPFCGGKNIDIQYLSLTKRYYFCRCLDCEAQTKSKTDKDKAIDAWNRRAADGHKNED